MGLITLGILAVILWTFRKEIREKLKI